MGRCLREIDYRTRRRRVASGGGEAGEVVKGDKSTTSEMVMDEEVVDGETRSSALAGIRKDPQLKTTRTGVGPSGAGVYPACTCRSRVGAHSTRGLRSSGANRDRSY